MISNALLDFLSIEGNEALQYSQFLKVWGTRERVNDIINPKYSSVGDVMLPRNAVIHYQQQLPNEVGPSNQAAFISNFDKRVNIYFWPDFEVLLGTHKKVPFNFNAKIKDYESGHFNYYRTRNYHTVIGKDYELLVNNMAMSQVPVVYRQFTFFSSFQQQYNVLHNLITAVNQFAQHDVHQFVEFKLPRSFPSYRTLFDAFRRYRKFFKDAEIVKYEKEALKPFQAESSFWLLDLFGILVGYDFAEFSQFNKLTEKAKSQLEFVFTFDGKCWVVNLQTLINLIGAGDKEGETTPSNAKFIYFKRFYLALIGLVTPMVEEIKNGKTEKESISSEGEAVTSKGKDKHEDGKGGSNTDIKDAPKLDTDNRPGSLADLYTGNKGSSNVDNPPPESEGGGDASENEDPDFGETTPEELFNTDIEDDVFEQASVENAVVTVKKTKYSPTGTIERILDKRAKRGQLTTKEKEFFTDAANSYKEIEFGGRTLEEIIDVKPEDLVFVPEKIAEDSVVISNKEVLQSRTSNLGIGYVERFLERDIIASILFGAQGGGIAILDMERESIITADSAYDVYTIKFQPIGEGNQSTRRFRIPKVAEDLSFTINGVKNYSQYVRMELPIRKIGKRKVNLSTYYDKRIMIERSPYRVDDFGGWLKTNIIQRSYLDKSIKVKLGSQEVIGKNVCWYYSVLAERFKEITIRDLVLNLDTRSILENHKEWKKLCNDKSWVVGEENGYPVLIDNSGLITVDGETKGFIEELIGLPMEKAPVPNTTVYINGYKFQSVVVLAYWMGFSELIKRVKPVHRFIEPGVRPNLSTNEYMVQFADERMVFDRRDELATLIFSGLIKLPAIKNFSRSQLDDPNVWFSIVNDSRVKPSHFKEMDQMFDQFIDPMHARELKKRKYPLELDNLVIKAIEMLLNNEAGHEVEITEQRIVGYERFAGHAYREMVKANRQFRNKPGGGKKTFDLNPESIMLAILTDSSCQPVEEVNPAHQIKQIEEVTFGGTFGRSDQAMVRRTRGQLPNYDGIISEAGKDSGKAGFVSYLTSDAKIVDYAGNVDPSLKTTSPGRLSVISNLVYGSTIDDSKRSLFSGVQFSQWMATESYQPSPLRTPYDSVIGYRNFELYTSVAKQNGTVKEVTDKGIVVEYEDGSEDTFFLGYEIGKGAGEYHKHFKVTDVSVGQTFGKGKVLAWDSVFYTRDTLDPNRVVLKSGTPSRIALIEDQFTFEDSIGITYDYAIKNSTPFIKINQFRVNYDQVLKLHVKEGDEVEYDQVLAEVKDQSSAMFDTDYNPMAGLERLGIKQEKAHQAGRIAKIEILYNGDYEDADDSVKHLIRKSDGERAKAAKYRKLYAPTCNVGGNTSVGKSKVYPNTVTVKIYIENMLVTTTADKFVIGNQMKGTVGFIYPTKIKTPDGRDVDITFSLKSLLNRMVLSLRDKLIANEINFVYTGRMITKYGRYD
ncbi:RNA polymerase [Aeromonas phage AerS_266]|nr:RNA polymerase [Aeromonas phage AerS_266]